MSHTSVTLKFTKLLQENQRVCTERVLECSRSRFKSLASRAAVSADSVLEARDAGPLEIIGTPRGHHCSSRTPTVDRDSGPGFFGTRCLCSAMKLRSSTRVKDVVQINRIMCLRELHPQNTLALLSYYLIALRDFDGWIDAMP